MECFPTDLGTKTAVVGRINEGYTPLDLLKDFKLARRIDVFFGWEVLNEYPKLRNKFEAWKVASDKDHMQMFQCAIRFLIIELQRLVNLNPTLRASEAKATRKANA